MRSKLVNWIRTQHENLLLTHRFPLDTPVCGFGNGLFLFTVLVAALGFLNNAAVHLDRSRFLQNSKFIKRGA